MKTMPPMVGRAALGVVGLRAVVADELAPVEPLEQPDEQRRQEQREDEREAGGDEEGDHSATLAEPVTEESQARRLRRLHEHDIPGAEFLTQKIVCRVDIGDEHRLPVPRTFEPGGQVDVAGPLADHDELADVEPHREPAEAVVLLLGELAELRHLAEHGDRALPGRDDLGERLQGGRRRIRARVVGVVDDGDAVAAVQHLHAPAFGARHGLDGGDRPFERDAELARDGERGEGVRDVVLAQDPQLHRDAALRRRRG